jgi:hypothetical protein
MVGLTSIEYAVTDKSSITVSEVSKIDTQANHCKYSWKFNELVNQLYEDQGE